ncbi:EscF/YscF/HrpA family type III secretion system needle major subunit [Yersinia mollaretii]|uniref:EscF/YscF/HrpA family type III secretion system needle major subunit n=1 Tax=Yersinia mollaretii TaxID=33060 RepID=UPI0011A0B5AD|nr:EscF/YscF/HrpA family type III secretion system needle major subunit [Yersinia mollaretii]
MAMPGINANGDWNTSTYEAIPTTTTGTGTSATTTSDPSWGFIYRSGAHLNSRVTELANKLQSTLSDPNAELDNPIVLAQISALNGHYNGARQAQSNLMKSVKDTSQAIIRNM